MTTSFFDPAALRTRLREQPSPDVPFLVVLLALLSYGLIMLFSAGYAVALYRRGDAYTYIRPQRPGSSQNALAARSYCLRRWAQRPCTPPAWWITMCGTNWPGLLWGCR